MCCRGWKASAPSGAGGFAGSPGGLGSGLGAFISSSGKSLIGPDQESSTLLKDRKSTRLNSSHGYISYAVFCLKKKKKYIIRARDLRTEHIMSVLHHTLFINRLV